MLIKKTQFGWSIIEAMIAVAIFAMMAAAVTSLLFGALNPWLTSNVSTQADALADEGLEAVRSIQARAWNELNINASGLAKSGNTWQWLGEGSTETVGDYHRQIILSAVCRDTNQQIADCPAVNPDPYTILVKSVVSWQTAFGLPKSITKSVYLTDWSSRWWSQADWSAGDGQAVWLDPSKYDSSQNINATTTNQLTLADNGDGTYQLTGWLESSAFNAGHLAKLQVISWNASTSASTTVQLQLRVAPDDNGLPGTWSSWFGANGDGTYFTQNQGTIISSVFNDNQWFQYRVELVGDGSATPTVNKISVNYK